MMDDITMSAIPEQPIWETLGRDDIEGIIRGNIRAVESKMAEITDHFCTTGYYLRRQQREDQWKETGAASFADYVRVTYGKSRGWATRMMQINERYSRDGNDPRLDDKYKAYTVSQLQEMLYLPEDVDGVTPDMTVRQIRAMRPKTEESPELAEVPAPATAEEPEVKAGQQAVDAGKVCDVAKDDEDGKREITRNEWAQMFEYVWRRLPLPEDITASKLRQVLNNTIIARFEFTLWCRPDGVTINDSREETWGTAAREMRALWRAKCMAGDVMAERLQAHEAAMRMAADNNAAAMQQVAAADSQGGQQETPANVCDVAKSEGAAAVDQDPDEAPVAEAQDDGQEGSRQQTDDGEGAAAVIARNVRYMAWEVDMYARDARKHYDELAALQDGLLQEGTDKLIPWTSIKKARMTADALEMLAATIRIHDAKDEED